MIGGLIYQQYHFANACSRRKSKTRNNFDNDRVVCIAENACAFRIGGGGIFIVLNSIIWNISERKPTIEYFLVFMVCKLPILLGNYAC